MISIDSFTKLYRSYIRHWNLLDLYPPLHLKYWVRHLDRLNPTTISWSTFWSISSVDHLRHPPLFFSLTGCRSKPPWDTLYDASVSSSSSYCRPPLAMIRSSPPRLPRSDLGVINPWRLHLDQYTLKIIDLYLRTNLNFLVVFFILMPPPNSIELTSSSSYRALESWTNTTSSDNICCDEIDILWYYFLHA